MSDAQVREPATEPDGKLTAKKVIGARGGVGQRALTAVTGSALPAEIGAGVPNRAGPVALPSDNGHRVSTKLNGSAEASLALNSPGEAALRW